MMTNAMSGLAVTLVKKLPRASRPPAEAPMPTTKKDCGPGALCPDGFEIVFFAGMLIFSLLGLYPGVGNSRFDIGKLKLGLLSS